MQIIASGIVVILVAIYPLSKIISRYLEYCEDRDWREIQKITKQKSVAVGQLAEL